MEQSSVKMVLGFSKEKGVEDQGIEPKLPCNYLLEVWHLFFFFVNFYYNYGLMMFAMKLTWFRVVTS